MEVDEGVASTPGHSEEAGRMKLKEEVKEKRKKETRKRREKEEGVGRRGVGSWRW